MQIMYIPDMVQLSEVSPIESTFNRLADGLAISPEASRARSLGQPEREGNFTPDEARGIYIRGYGVTSAEDKKPVLGTKGMGPCLAVAIYNPVTKAGTLAHFDTNTNTDSLNTMLQAVRSQGAVLQVHLAGRELGQPQSQKMVEDIIARLKSNADVTIKSADILNTSGGLKSLALDTRTGEVSNVFMGRQMDNGDRQNIMGFHASRAHTIENLRLEYSHGTSFSVEDWLRETPQNSMGQRGQDFSAPDKGLR
jgi:hypothetical protein